MPKGVDDDLTTFSLDEVAALLRLKPNKIRQLARSGEIGSRKVGGTYTFDPKHIRNFKTAHETPALPANPHGLARAPRNR